MPEQFKEGRHELTTIFLGRLILSAMFVISLKAFIIARSELLIVLRFWYFEFPNSSKLAAPVPWKEKFTSSIIQPTKQLPAHFKSKHLPALYILIQGMGSNSCAVIILTLEHSLTLFPFPCPRPQQHPTSSSPSESLPAETPSVVLTHTPWLTVATEDFKHRTLLICLPSSFNTSLEQIPEPFMAFSYYSKHPLIQNKHPDMILAPGQHRAAPKTILLPQLDEHLQLFKDSQ